MLGFQLKTEVGPHNPVLELFGERVITRRGFSITPTYGGAVPTIRTVGRHTTRATHVVGESVLPPRAEREYITKSPVRLLPRHVILPSTGVHVTFIGFYCLPFKKIRCAIAPCDS